MSRAKEAVPQPVGQTVANFGYDDALCRSPCPSLAVASDTSGSREKLAFDSALLSICFMRRSVKCASQAVCHPQNK